MEVSAGRRARPMMQMNQICLLAAKMGLFSPYEFVQACRTLIGFNLSLLPVKTRELQGAAQKFLEAWKLRRIRPILGPRFAFEHLPDAHRALAGRGTSGKVVVTIAG
jgi:NADPH:quinone reductase-like Zn-dependent oxidoreductase